MVYRKRKTRKQKKQKRTYKNRIRRKSRKTRRKSRRTRRKSRKSRRKCHKLHRSNCVRMSNMKGGMRKVDFIAKLKKKYKLSYLEDVASIHKMIMTKLSAQGGSSSTLYEEPSVGGRIVKIFNIVGKNSAEANLNQAEILNEIIHLEKLPKHSSIMGYYGFFIKEDEGDVYILMEKCEGKEGIVYIIPDEKDPTSGNDVFGNEYVCVAKNGVYIRSSPSELNLSDVKVKFNFVFTPGLVTKNQYMSMRLSNGKIGYVPLELGGKVLFRKFNGNLSVDNFISIARQLLEGLSALQGSGMLHGDIKPDNIMISEDDPPAVKLIDFGSTRGYNEDIHMVQYPPTRIGTSAWSHPDRLDMNDNKKAIDWPLQTKIDSYALCLILVTLLKGSPYASYKVDLFTGLTGYEHNKNEGVKTKLRSELRKFIRSPKTYILSTNDIKKLNNKDTKCTNVGGKIEELFNNLLGWNGGKYDDGYFETFSFESLLGLPLFKGCAGGVPSMVDDVVPAAGGGAARVPSIDDVVPLVPLVPMVPVVPVVDVTNFKKAKTDAEADAEADAIATGQAMLSFPDEATDAEIAEAEDAAAASGLGF